MWMNYNVKRFVESTSARKQSLASISASVSLWNDISISANSPTVNSRDVFFYQDKDKIQALSKSKFFLWAAEPPDTVLLAD